MQIPTGRGLATFFACLLTMSLSLATAAYAAPPPPETTAALAYEHAQRAYESSDFAKAVEWLEIAYARDRQPRYVYNIGRAQEGMGALAEAYETYLRVLALPEVDDSVRRLADARMQRLDGVRNRAVVRVLGAPDGALLQLDARALPAAETEHQVEPGEHQLCVINPGGRVVLCDRRNLRAGRRLDWDLAAAQARGVLRAERLAGLSEISLNGHVLLVDLRTLTRLVLPAGSHRLWARWSDDSSSQLFLTVVPGSEVDLAPLIEGARRGAGAPLASIGDAAPGGGGGAWPWVVVGAGAVSAGAGVFFVAQAASDRSSVKDVTNDITQREAEQTWDDAAQKDVMGWTLVGVGAAAAIGGIAWWALSGSGGDEVAAAPAWWLAVHPTSGLNVGGRF